MYMLCMYTCMHVCVDVCMKQCHTFHSINSNFCVFHLHGNKSTLAHAKGILVTMYIVAFYTSDVLRHRTLLCK